MIHDDLERHLGRCPQPSLSADFGAKLGRRLHAVVLRQPLSGALASRAPRIYWVIAVLSVAYFWRPSLPSPQQVALLAAWAAIVVLTLRRALGSGPLPHALRQAFWRG
jgi:hypothetical protein